MDFGLDRETEALKERVRAFLEEAVIPREGEAARNLDSLEAIAKELQGEAKRRGLFLPHMPKALGGLGLTWTQLAVVLEEAGRSLLGPKALNASAPDEGNMHLLEKVGSEAQKRRYLHPLLEGEIRSAFAMTEPMGAGADPSLLKATARRKGRGFVLEGRKWFITGAEGAAFFIVLARAEEGPTLFLVDRENPGLKLVRTIPTMDHWSIGGHGELVLEGCEVGEEAVLGEVGQGFAYAELRLDPARLTHCMRWLGVGVRATELAQAYALQRDSFGKKLAEHQGVQFMIADSHMELHAARLMVWHAAWKLDRGERIRHEASMAKVFVAEAVGRAVDRAVQITGGLGISEDIPLSIFYREVRPFRIYDGPSEVHRASIGKRALYKGLRP
ncbi:MAG: acyl-CoA dehydrogenase family protein [Thermus sp.]|uniref:acyl-CoA dehydrogenase family protein n=1 Tax=unclassified Thermus TaxID=2619321 RepID=UPI00059E4EFD|nr:MULTISPECIES: acyl-CoA dehydrogenase family protein [unclassified Thermus]MCS6868958.1 acyl-CoA dehydrogenase family protein [Thermus sp.]MCS7219222.1 acyl-CoA dehydrogenase family protein [Thermus sp.]MCX7850444.1 acyl-CoA dehydrogenase family protein [Thermus sp.]MDW8358645.1 acyl-CoA dehydrogenase family protein [Thermus sp.]